VRHLLGAPAGAPPRPVLPVPPTVDIPPPRPPLEFFNGLGGFANDGWGLVVARVGGPEFAARPKELSHTITVRKAWLGIGQSSIYLKPNQHITVGQLVQGLARLLGLAGEAVGQGLRAVDQRLDGVARGLGVVGQLFTTPDRFLK